MIYFWHKKPFFPSLCFLVFSLFHISLFHNIRICTCVDYIFKDEITIMILKIFNSKFSQEKKYPDYIKHCLFFHLPVLKVNLFLSWKAKKKKAIKNFRNVNWRTVQWDLNCRQISFHFLKDCQWLLFLSQASLIHHIHSKFKWPIFQIL